jgi:hypothetical protein
LSNPTSNTLLTSNTHGSRQLLNTCTQNQLQQSTSEFSDNCINLNAPTYSQEDRFHSFVQQYTALNNETSYDNIVVNDSSLDSPSSTNLNITDEKPRPLPLSDYQQVPAKSSEKSSLKNCSKDDSSSSSPPPPPYSPPVLSVYSMSIQQQQQSGSSIITQVTADQSQGPGFFNPELAQSTQFVNSIKLDLRGTIIELTRSELSQLPESILLGISNGLCTDYMGNVMFVSGEEIATVNFSPECLQYTLGVFREASKELAATQAEQTSTIKEQAGFQGENQFENIADLLKTKPAIIVLREDLDYYCMPPGPDVTREEMLAIKRECGRLLVERNQIFTGLQQGDKSGSAEQHLIEMLCSSGFSIDETWGFRALEPNKTVVSSLALVRLKPSAEETAQPQRDLSQVPENSSIITETPAETVTTLDGVEADPINKDPEADEGTTVKIQPVEMGSKYTIASDTNNANVHDVTATLSDTTILTDESLNSAQPTPQEPSQQQQQEGEENEINIPAQSPEADLARSHKLLLFWRKPARKCWWDSVSFDKVPNVDGPVKVHVRSVWTLELSVIEH